MGSTWGRTEGVQQMVGHARSGLGFPQSNGVRGVGGSYAFATYNYGNDIPGMS